MTIKIELCRCGYLVELMNSVRFSPFGISFTVVLGLHLFTMWLS